MTLKLGRVGTDIALADPDTWGRNSNKVTISGYADGATTVADGITLSEQLLGLVDNPDEPLVACTWSEEPWFDGYYAVKGVDIGSESPSLATGWFPYRIQLERVADGASPTIDVTLLGALRTNGNSVTSGRASSWAPSAMQGGYAKGGVFTSGGSVAYNQTGSAQSRTTETGAVISAQTTGASAVTNAYGNFDVSPANYYNGHCTIRSGATLRRVIGARMKSLPVNWELSNGLIRVTPAANSTLQVEVFDGSVWEDAKTFQFTNGSSTTNIFGSSTAWGDISVIRNSPECVAIRLRPGFTGGDANSGVHIDLTLQRGRYFLDVFAMADTNAAATGNYGLGRTANEAATAITGGIRATSNDAAGNRYVLACAKATTNDLTRGEVHPTSGTNYSNLMVGYELGGSGSAAPNTAQNIVDEWYYPFEERMAPRTR